MQKIKIGYFADGPWSHNAFKLLIEDPSIEVAFIVPRTDTKDITLKNFAEQYGIDYLLGTKINSDEFYEHATEYGCDLFVSMSFNQIFRHKITNLPPLKTINCHAGKLPFYRGRNILNWVLINDEKEFGITVHYIDDGIDTGDIILQKTYPITDQDTYLTLLEVAYKECASLLYESIKLIQEGKVEPFKQVNIHPIGLYCGVRGEGDEIVDWDQSSREIFNFIRAVSHPGPRATTHHNGSLIKINGAVLIPEAPAYKSTVGQIVGKTDRGFIVKTKDTTIEVFEIETDIRLKIGDRLSNG
jgi:methionyl-tRNA formyltransferase